MLYRDCKLLKSNSFFLFGPRGVGKTTLIRGQFKDDDAIYIDLLDIDLMDQLRLDAGRFKHIIDSPDHINKAVIVDEVQKFPKILDEIDLVIERPGAKDLFIEIKSKQQVREADVKSLETLGMDTDPNAEKWLLSCDTLEHKIGHTRALHWTKGLQELFGS